MRTFPSAFITEKNKKTDLAPVWFLRLTVAGVDYWLSDNTFSVSDWQGGISTLPWIKSWGQLQEGISSGLDEFHVSDFSCSCLIDPAAATNMETLAEVSTLEQSPAELYLWFHGLDPVTNPPQRMWRGYIKDVSIPDDLTVDLVMEDETTRLNKFVGSKINVTTHPLADPDDIGKVIPIVFGTVSKLPALCVDSGWVTSIINDISDTATTITVSELPAYSVLNKSITIDDEQIYITGYGTGSPTVKNCALSSNGGVMSAPSTTTNFEPSHMNNGVRICPASYPYDGWYAPSNPYMNPASLICNFSDSKDINEIRVYFQPDDYTTNQTEPDINRAATAASHRYFDFAVLVNGTWQTVYTTSTNDKALVISTFSTVTATAIRLNLNGTNRTGNQYGLIVELEAWGSDVVTPSTTLAVTRGYNSTTKTMHTKGSTVIEKKTTPLVYLSADHAVDAIGTVMARVRGVDIDITSDVTKYLGTSGNQLAAYPGKAAITVADFARVKQRISIALSGGVSSSDAGHSHSAGSSVPILSASHTGTGTSTTYGYVYIVMTAAQNIARTYIEGVAMAAAFTAVTGTIQTCSMTATVTVNGIWDTGTWYLACNGRRVSPIYTGDVTNFAVPITHDSASMQGNTLSLVLGFSGDGTNKSWNTWQRGYISAAARSITYTNTSTVVIAPSASAVTVSSTLTLSGNSVADIMIGDMILVDITRNITAPQAVLQNLITNYGSGATISTVGTMPAGYLIKGAITEYKQLREWCNIIAFQCRSRFRTNNGAAQLMVRPDTITPIKTIPQCVQNSGFRTLTRTKVAISEIINKITILFDRDWTKTGDDAYTQTTASNSSASIAVHGELERPELFRFDFVTDAAMAQSVRDFYLNWHSTRRWIYTFDAYLDHCELEFNDHIILGFLDNKTAIISEAQLNPGESTRMDKVTFVAEG